MTQKKNNSTNNGPSGKNRAKLFTLASPAKKTASEKVREPARNPSKNGSPISPNPLSATESENTSKPKPLPVPKLPVKVDRTKEALRRLKIKPEQLRTAQQITPLFEKAEGGLSTVLDAMRFSAQDETIAAFLKKYDSIPGGDRENLPWEAIALSAKIDLQRLTGAILFALQAASVNTVKVIALSSHPLIMERTIAYAQMPGGVKDRNMIHQALGFLPSPKGPTFIGKAVFGPDGGRAKEEPAEAAIFDEDGDLKDLFPDAAATQEILVPIRQRLLNDGKAASRE